MWPCDTDDDRAALAPHPGSKSDFFTEGNGVPRTVIIPAAQRNDREEDRVMWDTDSAVKSCRQGIFFLFLVKQVNIFSSTIKEAGSAGWPAEDAPESRT